MTKMPAGKVAFRAAFNLYRASPFAFRNFIGRCLRPIGFLLRPFSIIAVGDYRMVLDFTDNASFKYASDRDQYEPLEMHAFRSAIKASRDCIVVDLGANYGAYTFAAAQLAKCGVAAHVIAIEPDRRPFNALRKSVILNEFESVCDVYQMIVGDEDGFDRLWVNARSSADNRSHSVLTSKIRVRESYEVRMTTIDTLLSETGIPRDRPLIVKMDIQGNEPRALYGMKQSLQMASSWVILFEHGPYLIESAGIDLESFLGWMYGLNPDAGYAITPDRGFIKLKGRDGLTAAMRKLDSDPHYNGEAPVSNFIIARGVNPAAMATIAGASN